MPRNNTRTNPEPINWLYALLNPNNIQLKSQNPNLKHFDVINFFGNFNFELWVSSLDSPPKKKKISYVTTEMTKYTKDGYKSDGLSKYINKQSDIDVFQIRELTDDDTGQVLNWQEMNNTIFFHP